MKLESTLDSRAGILHAAPLLDVVVLMLVFFLLGSGFVLQSGVSVSLPTSSSSMQPLSGAHVVTIAAGEDSPIYFNEQRVTMSELIVELKESRSSSRHVILRADELVNYRTMMQVTNIVLAEGYHMALATDLGIPKE